MQLINHNDLLCDPIHRLQSTPHADAEHYKQHHDVGCWRRRLSVSEYSKSLNNIRKYFEPHASNMSYSCSQEKSKKSFSELDDSCHLHSSKAGSQTKRFLSTCCNGNLYWYTPSPVLPKRPHCWAFTVLWTNTHSFSYLGAFKRYCVIRFSSV